VNPTRSLTGARCRLARPLLAALALAAVATTVSEAARIDEMLGALPWRVGGRVGFTVDAAAFPDSAGHMLDVYVRIPPVTIEALTLDSLATGKLRLTARLRSGFAGKQATQTQEVGIAAGDSARGFGRVVLLRFPLLPGPQRLAIKLEDARSRKRGIAYLGRKVAESAQVEGEFVVTVPKSGVDLSDMEFVWSETAGREGSAFLRGGRDVLPNPERLYGLHAPEVRAFFVARGDSGEGRPWRWKARVLDSASNVVAERESTGAAAPRLDAETSFDLTREPAGAYTLEVRAWRDGDKIQALRQAKFSIAWRQDSWFRNPRDVEDAVHLLLPPDDEEAFAHMQPGEQERILDEFWRVRDPSPGTAHNEALHNFERRVAYANLTYARLGQGPGMLTDMGRVYVRYGEPSEVLRQVIPSGDNTLLQALREIQITEDRPLGDVEQKGPGGDMRPFEVWIYEGDIPPPVDADPREKRVNRKRLVFLFVDEMGLGQYTQRYSTE